MNASRVTGAQLIGQGLAVFIRGLVAMADDRRLQLARPVLEQADPEELRRRVERIGLLATRGLTADANALTDRAGREVLRARLQEILDVAGLVAPAVDLSDIAFAAGPVPTQQSGA